MKVLKRVGISAAASVLFAMIALPAVGQGRSGVAEQGRSGERYIVVYKDARQARAALRNAGASIALELPRHNAKAAYIPEAALSQLQRNPAIDFIEVDTRRYPSGDVTPYGISMVEADQVSQSGSSHVTMCIIDSGYDASHPDLQKTGVTYSFDTGTGPASVDGCGHGTHVAGTVAALSNGFGVVGVNPTGDLPLHIVKVFNDSCNWTYSSSLVAALDECQLAGDKVVVNMSLGGGRANRTERNAFARAYNTGRVLSVAAAGNNGSTQYSYPASYSSVISVGAVDANEQVAWFSQRNDEVELAAPGVGVLSTVPNGGYQAWNGTSMAAPHVAGVAALVWNLIPEATSQDIRVALTSSARDIGAPGYDTSTGYGLVQAVGTLHWLGYSFEDDSDPVDDGGSNDDPVDDGGSIEDDAPVCWDEGMSCSSNNECCSGKCRGKGGAQTCR